MSNNQILINAAVEEDRSAESQLEELSVRRIRLVDDAPLEAFQAPAWGIGVLIFLLCLGFYYTVPSVRVVPVPTFGVVATAVGMFGYYGTGLAFLLRSTKIDMESLNQFRMLMAGKPVSQEHVWKMALSALRPGSPARFWVTGLCSSSELDRPDLQAIAEAATFEQGRPKAAANLFLLLSLSATILGLFQVISGLGTVLFTGGQSPDIVQQRISQALPHMATAFLGTAVGILLSVLYTCLSGFVNKEIDRLEAATERFVVLELAPALLPRAPERVLETLRESIELILEGQRALSRYQSEIRKSVASLSSSADQLRTDSEKAFAEYARSTDAALKSGRRLLELTDQAMQKSGDRLREATNDVSKHATEVVRVLGKTAEALQKVLVENVGPASGELKVAADRILSSAVTVEQATKSTPAAVTGLSQNINSLNTTLSGLGTVTTELRNLEAELKRTSQTIGTYAAGISSLPRQEVYISLSQTISGMGARLDSTVQAIGRLEAALQRAANQRVV